MVGPVGHLTGCNPSKSIYTYTVCIQQISTVDFGCLPAASVQEDPVPIQGSLSQGFIRLI